MGIDAFLDYLKYERRYSEHTLRAYESDLEAFADYLGCQNEIRSAEAHELRIWLVECMEAGASPRSVQRKLSSLRSYFRTLKAKGHRKDNPCATLKGPKAAKGLPVTPSESELFKMLFEEELYPDDHIGRRDKMLLYLLYSTGMRTAELQGLRLSDLDMERQEIMVMGKRQKQRLIPITKALVQALRVYLAERPLLQPKSEHLFLTDKGNKLYPGFVYRKANHYIGLVSSLKKRSPHVLRHAFATHMLEHGAELQSIKDLLGHASLASTQVYTHTDMERLRRIHRQTHPRA